MQDVTPLLWSSSSSSGCRDVSRCLPFALVQPAPHVLYVLHMSLHDITTAESLREVSQPQGGMVHGPQSISGLSQSCTLLPSLTPPPTPHLSCQMRLFGSALLCTFLFAQRHASQSIAGIFTANLGIVSFANVIPADYSCTQHLKSICLGN